jgi:threonine aldolase
MRRRMAEAEVGDDVLGDDPTVHALEDRSAELLGTEAALFLPSGTMSNQVAIKALTEPGEEILCEEHSHVFLYEAGALGLIAGVQPRTLPSAAGVLEVERLREAIRTDDVHHPRTALIAFENTHNYSGGRVVPLDRRDALCALARKSGLRVFLDGARLFNAAVALGEPPARLCRDVDLTAFCLSKGLGCPVGSMLAGSREWIGRCRRLRKAFGGGMRQAGILAAAGLFALDHLVERLAEDHALARRLAAQLAAIDSLDVRPADVDTNIVLLHRPARDADAFRRRLAAHGVLCSTVHPGALRFVTHRDVAAADVDRAVRATQAVSASPSLSAP